MKSHLKTDTYHLKTIGIWIILLMVIVGQLVFYAWCRFQCINVGYEITAESEKYEKQMAIQKSLNIELATLKSTERLYFIARNQLGLMPPDPRQTVIIK